jgi:hypothetical protein
MVKTRSRPCPRHERVCAERRITALILNFGNRWRWLVIFMRLTFLDTAQSSTEKQFEENIQVNMRRLHNFTNI